MISKYNGICFYCKQPTKANVDEYELDSKKSFHVACKEQDEAQPSPEQFTLADKLGYLSHRSWDLLLLPPAANSDPAWWDRSETSGRDTVRGVPSSDEVENIGPARGTES